MRYFGKTDKGMVRTDNQDNFKCFEYSDALVCILCDGMGGVSCGRLASELAIDSFVEKFTELSKPYVKSPSAYSLSMKKIIENSVIYANKVVYNKSFELGSPREMGTTLVCAVIYSGTLYVANVGDSRLYEYQSQSLTRLTKDHSYVQFLLDIGKIKNSEAQDYENNVITRAIGLDQDVEVDTYVIDQDPESVYLLCSDGLYNMVGEDTINTILDGATSEKDICQVVDELVANALEEGGLDNITTVIIAP